MGPAPPRSLSELALDIMNAAANLCAGAGVVSVDDVARMAQVPDLRTVRSVLEMIGGLVWVDGTRTRFAVLRRGSLLEPPAGWLERRPPRRAADPDTRADVGARASSPGAPESAARALGNRRR